MMATTRCMKCGRTWEVDTTQCHYEQLVPYCTECAPEPPIFTSSVMREDLLDYEEFERRYRDAYAEVMKGSAFSVTLGMDANKGLFFEYGMTRYYRRAKP